MFIDTHCHLNFKDFRNDFREVIERTLSEGVEMIIVGSQYSTSRRAVEQAERYGCSEKGGVWAVVGIHPVHLFKSGGDLPEEMSLEKFDYGKYLELAKKDEVVAIGEVGLDYHHFKKAQQEVGKIIELQKDVFREFIKLANDVGKPVVIHGWNADKKDKELVGGAVAYEDILGIIKNNRVEKKGVVHSFIGNYKMAQKFIEEGFLIGLNGIITYSESYDRLIREVGLENIVIETDAPYLTPAPLERYSRNEPLNVKLVAQKIADVLGVEASEVERVTTENARRLFAI